MSLGVSTERKRIEKARREAQARLGCAWCGASKDDIRDEQARLKADFYARRNGRHTSEGVSR
jgi:hypothetical protein